MAASLDHRTQQMDGPPVDEEKIGDRAFCHSAHTHTQTHFGVARVCFEPWRWVGVEEPADAFVLALDRNDQILPRPPKSKTGRQKNGKCG